MATENKSEFGKRMSVEKFLSDTGSKNLDVYPRADKVGYYYFATEKTLGYVPQELGKKIDYIKKHRADIEAKEARGEKLNDGEKLGSLFITEVTTEGYDEPMFMLCESKRESLLHFSVD
ncbi:MAG: hypothetical protein SPD90_01135 [Intestinibacter sp.]|uniref:hypothetical protein n=1 Tax=Intestinibacter sp. TaxID=1965304 RepID=UPI002A81050A|nr:hypothetical protein [Intestinibacter sp.]MDY4573640.1 hypothetical protein [Intestinibacter sp.]